MLQFAAAPPRFNRVLETLLTSLEQGLTLQANLHVSPHKRARTSYSGESDQTFFPTITGLSLDDPHRQLNHSGLHKLPRRRVLSSTTESNQRDSLLGALTSALYQISIHSRHAKQRSGYYV